MRKVSFVRYVLRMCDGDGGRTKFAKELYKTMQPCVALHWPVGGSFHLADFDESSKVSRGCRGRFSRGRRAAVGSESGGNFARRETSPKSALVFSRPARTHALRLRTRTDSRAERAEQLFFRQEFFPKIFLQRLDLLEKTKRS